MTLNVDTKITSCLIGMSGENVFLIMHSIIRMTSCTYLLFTQAGDKNYGWFQHDLGHPKVG